MLRILQLREPPKNYEDSSEEKERWRIRQSIEMVNNHPKSHSRGEIGPSRTGCTGKDQEIGQGAL